MSASTAYSNLAEFVKAGLVTEHREFTMFPGVTDRPERVLYETTPRWADAA